MYKNFFKYSILAGMIIFSLSAKSQPPYMIQKAISENKLVNFTNQKLLIIDFWATWCSPCGPATEQLEILQRSNPNDVFIVSVSDESEETILNYLQRNPIQLAVVQDYLPNSMVSLFGAKSRPYAVLLSLDGKILYKGHPANITADVIKKYANQMKSKPQKYWNDLFYAAPTTISKNLPSQKEKELAIVKQSGAEKNMYVENGIFHYSGPLSELIKYLADCSNYQIILQGIDDYGVSMSCSESDVLNSKPAILQLIEKPLSIKILSGSKPMQANILEVANAKKLWDDKQINWGSNTSATYFVGNDHIEADNLSVKAIANLLSDTKRVLYYYNGKDTNLHDWNFHYLYDDLMKENLENNFGIKIKKGEIDLPIYILSPQ
jgi:thiol-disulfide isomerase/thioredoxin